MDTDSPKSKMIYWARDFIQQEQDKKGFCSRKDYNEIFKRFKNAYGYEGTTTSILKTLKENKFIEYNKEEIKWIVFY